MDTATVALTGRLPFYLLLAMLLTWPVTVALMRLYLRAVRRSMLRGSSTPIDPPPRPSAEVDAPVLSRPRASFVDAANLPLSPAAASLADRWRRRPRQAAMAYALGCGAYALVLTWAEFVSEGLEFLPLRFAMLFWVAFWPVVLVTAMVGALTRRGVLALVVGYLAVIALIGAVVVPVSPELTWWNIFAPWAVQDLAPTLLLVTYLSRPVRAAGPLVLLFVFVSLLGSDLLLSLFGSSDTALRALIELLDRIGLGAISVFLAIAALGFFILAIVGAIALRWIRARYEAKALSDESVTVDSIMLLFAINHGMNLVFAHPLWFLAALVAFAAFKLVSNLALARLATTAGRGTAPRLLLLRSFSIGRASERLFDRLMRHWRRAGSVQMISGLDFATRTVDPQELLDFTAGKLSRRFIGDDTALEQRLRERDLRPDRDGRFRINEFFCHDHTWRQVLMRLVGDSDIVLMDLRGFTKTNTGCLFELHELSRSGALARVVFLVNDDSDESLMAAVLGVGEASVWRCGKGAEPDHLGLLGAFARVASASSAA